jgi:hypothetical protein
MKEKASGEGALIIKIQLIFFLVLCCQHLAFAQFSPGTRLNVGSDMKIPIRVDPDDLKLKTQDGKVFATIQDYSAELSIMKGAVVEIRRQGGFLNNLEWCKGIAKVNESFNIEGFAVVREITYLNGVPSITNCTVNGVSSDGMVKFNNSISIDLKDPKLALWLKPYSALARNIYLASLAIAVLIVGVIVWLVVRGYKQRHVQSNTPV